jgi:hypothetical protein
MGNANLCEEILKFSSNTLTVVWASAKKMSISIMLVFFWVYLSQVGQALAFPGLPLQQPHSKTHAAAYQKNKFSTVLKPCNNRPTTTHCYSSHDNLAMSKGSGSTGGTDDADPNIPSNGTIAELQTNDVSLSVVLTSIMSSINELKDDTKKLKNDTHDPGRFDVIYQVLIILLWSVALVHFHHRATVEVEPWGPHANLQP